jgi:hypothetical protein
VETPDQPGPASSIFTEVSTLTVHIEEPGRTPVSRRQALRTGGVLGLAAASVALTGAGAQAATTPAADFPDPTGAFGHPVAGDTRAHQLRRAATPAPRHAGAGPPTVYRLPASTVAIDSTPLARRAPIWTVEG